jgi:thiamine-phosphate pyrophosphorylase
MPASDTDFAQRLVLVLHAQADHDLQAQSLRAALSGGEVASLILVQDKLDEAAFSKTATTLTPIAQEAGVAVIFAGDSRAVGRAGADGIHLPADPHQIDEAVKKAAGKTIVGADAGRTRDQALNVGEMRPDYVLIGKLDGDTHPEPHPRNIELASWWSELIEVSAIVMAGSIISSVTAAAETGAEFIGLGQAVFGAADPAEAVAEANRLIAEVSKTRHAA